MFGKALHLAPFWSVIVFALYWITGFYTAVIIASVLFGAVEILKAKKLDQTRWKEITKDIGIIGHRACARNAPENTLAGIYV